MPWALARGVGADPIFKEVKMNPETVNAVLLTEKEAAPILRTSIRTLQKWRVNGNGPPFIRISARAIRYRRSDLDVRIPVQADHHSGLSDQGFGRLLG